MALGGATEAARRLVQRAEEELPSVLLTAENARILAQRLSRLRGAAMKVGQMLSLEGDSILPREFAQALEILRSSAHKMPEKQLLGVLEKQLGRDWEKRFAWFDRNPIASASIGQVHAARTHDGQDIVLKIQYPGVAESIDSDVDNLKSLLALSRVLPGDLDLDDFAGEVKAELRREVDYVRELESLAAYRAAIEAAVGLPFPEHIYVPRGLGEHSTARVLCMERVAGVPLLTWAEHASPEERNQVAEMLVRLLVRELLHFGLCQTDPNPANYFYDAATQRLVLLDLGALRAVPPEVSELYRKATRALVNRDRTLVKEVYVEMGFFVNPDSPGADLIVDMGLLTSEIFEDAPYDYAASNLAPRMRDLGLKLVPHRKDLRPPPPEYVFFQRKLSGTYLLLKQLRASINLRPLLVEGGVFAS